MTVSRLETSNGRAGCINIKIFCLIPFQASLYSGCFTSQPKIELWKCRWGRQHSIWLMGSLTIIHLLDSRCWSWSRRGQYEPRFGLDAKRKMGHHQNFHSTNCLPAFDWSCSAENIMPGELIGTNKDSYLVLDTLPAEFDNHVKAMEVDEWATET